MANNVSLTAEQQAVKNCTDKFVLVSACPGSGKSYTLRNMRRANGDITLSFAKSDADAARKQLEGAGDSDTSKTVRTMDSLALQCLHDAGIECKLTNTDYFDGNHSDALNEFARVFYDGSGDNPFDAVNDVMRAMNKKRNGRAVLIKVKELGKFVSDYMSTGVLPSSNSARKPLNDFVQNWVKFLRKIAAVNYVREFFVSDDNWNLLVRLSFGYIDSMRAALGVSADISDSDLRSLVSLECKRRLMDAPVRLFTNRKLWTVLDSLLANTGWIEWSRDFMEAGNWMMLDKKDKCGLNAHEFSDAMILISSGISLPRDYHNLHYRGQKLDEALKDVHYRLAGKLKPETVAAWDSGLHIPDTYSVSELSCEFYRLALKDKQDADANGTEPSMLQSVADSMNFDRILVDEGQDMSTVQANIIDRFAADTDVRVVVFYDGDQSLYEFRNAAGNLALLGGSYETATRLNLTYNFRSTHAIIDVANALRSNIADSAGKTIVANRPEIGVKPVVKGFASPKDEAIAITAWVEAKLDALRAYVDENPDEARKMYDNIAVIVRSHFVGDLILRELRARLSTAGVRVADRPTVIDSDGKRVPQHVYVINAHQSKGREYSCVWVAGVDNHVWPYEITGKTRTRADRRTDLQSELRLLFVAVTRARNELVLSYAAYRQLSSELRVNKDGIKVENKYGKQMTGASRFLKAPLRSKNPVVYIPANLTDWEEISKLSERKEALKMLDADLEDFALGKVSNYKIQKSFETFADINNTLQNRSAASLGLDPDPKFEARAERIGACANTLDIGLFKTDAEIDGLFAGITNYHRCRDRMCAIDQAMDAAELGGKLLTAMEIIQYALQAKPVYEIEWERAAAGEDADSNGFKLDSDGNRIPLLDALGRRIPVYLTDGNGNVLLDSRGHKRQKPSGTFSASIPANSRHLPITITYTPEQLHHDVDVKWNHSREKDCSGRKDVERFTLDKGWSSHSHWLFLTITEQNIKLEDVLNEDEHGRNRIQDFGYRVMNALNPSRRRDWARRNINGVWMTIEITVKEDAAGQVWLHVHAHCLLDMNKNYRGFEFKRQGLAWQRGTDGKYVLDSAGNRMPLLDSNSNQVVYDEWAQYLQKSMKLSYLPIVRVERVVDKPARDCKPGEAALGTIFVELTKYATKPAELYSCDPNDPEHYVSKSNVDRVVRILAEAMQGVRMKRAYGSIKEAMDVADGVLAAMRPDMQLTDKAVLVFNEADKHYEEADDNEKEVSVKVFDATAAAVPVDEYADDDVDMSALQASEPDELDDGYYAVVDADAAVVDDLLPYESDTDEQIITYVSDLLDVGSMFANNSDDSGADDDNVDSDDSSLDGDSDSGYEKYDELFE